MGTRLCALSNDRWSIRVPRVIRVSHMAKDQAARLYFPRRLRLGSRRPRAAPSGARDVLECLVLFDLTYVLLHRYGIRLSDWVQVHLRAYIRWKLCVRTHFSQASVGTRSGMTHHHL